MLVFSLSFLSCNPLDALIPSFSAFELCVCVVSAWLSVVLLALLVVARGGSFMVEQPGGSYMEYYDKMMWLYQRVPVIWLQ